MVRYVRFGAPGGSPAELVGRAAQCARLEGVLATARTGTSAVLAVTGEPGAGKTALLGYAVKAADGTSETFVVNSSTKVGRRTAGQTGKAGASTISAVKPGDTVLVTGTGTTTVTAKHVVDVTT